MAFDHLNKDLFDQALPACLITFQREKKTMGYYSENRFTNRQGSKTDEIALNPSYFAPAGVDVALQTVGHEMVHMWQAKFGTPGRGRYHNAQWAHYMERIGLMPSSTGRPGGRKTGDSMNDYIIEGGRFEESIARLKSEGFELKWMDRFVGTPTKFTEAYYQLTTHYSESGSLSASSAEYVSSPAALEIISIAETCDLDYTKLTNPQPTRVKYHCACDRKINIWAKPGIKVTCNECSTEFVPAS